MPKRKLVKIDEISIDDKVHPRHTIDSNLVAEYAESLRGGAKFPPITVYQDHNKYYLADGRHRLEASVLICRNEIDAEVFAGTKKDAILFAVGANSTHGIRRSNADKRKSIKIMLADKEWRTWSINRISQQCHVSDGLVTKVWKDVQEELHLPKLEDASERKALRNGKPYSLKTKKIGKKKAEQQYTSARAIYSVISEVSRARDRLAEENKTELTKKIDAITNELELLLGETTGADARLTEGLNQPINVYRRPRNGGISATPEFAKKKLCNYALGVGMACGHQCTYCSSPALLRTQAVYIDIQQTSYQKGYAIIDPDTHQRVKSKIPKLTKYDVIQISTTDDAWSPEARKYGVGRKSMKALLESTPAQIRVLTKCADVSKDFDLFAKYKKRVIVGLSTGIPRSKEGIASIIEPNASPIKDRLNALKKAQEMGLRTYGMLCPCLPLIASSKSDLDGMFDDVISCGAEDIWFEPVNARGNALGHTEQQLRRAGYLDEANAVHHIRKRDNWSLYVVELIKNAIEIAKKKNVLNKLHILLYPSGLQKKHAAELKKCKTGIIWLGDEK